MFLQEAQIEQLDVQKQEIIEKCELEQISLPTISDPMDTDTSIPGPVFDFDQLSRALKDRRHSDRDKIEVEFKQKMDTLISEIERTAPNLKALDQYEALLEKERAVTEEFEAVRKEEKEKADRFNSVKQRRYKLFVFRWSLHVLNEMASFFFFPLASVITLHLNIKSVYLLILHHLSFCEAEVYLLNAGMSCSWMLSTIYLAI